MRTTTMYSAPPVDIPPLPTPLKGFHNRHYHTVSRGRGALCTDLYFVLRLTWYTIRSVTTLDRPAPALFNRVFIRSNSVLLHNRFTTLEKGWLNSGGTVTG